MYLIGRSVKLPQSGIRREGWDTTSPGRGQTDRPPLEVKPSVSICIPLYNGAKHLNECLTSALAQTHTAFEVVLVDDGSIDDTVAIAERFANTDSRIRLCRNSKNLGLSANWRRCVELAQGEWIKFLFQDDFLTPDCLSRMLEATAEDRRF